MPRSDSPPDQRTAILCLGMHRSGTSATLGVIGLLGCDLPRTLMPANSDNRKGYYESIPICQLNDAVLASAGSSWDDWQAFNPGWIGSHRAEEFLPRGLSVLDEEFGDSGLPVMKDPRICRLMPFWRRLLDEAGIEPACLLIHRNPVEVAASLEHREGWPFAYGLLLWLRHVLDAENGSRGLKRHVISYDRLLGNWGATMLAVQEALGVSFPRWSETVATEVDEFLSTDLRNHRTDPHRVIGDPFLSSWVRDTYAILERWADEGETPGDRETLDGIRADFNAAAPMFGGLIRTARKASGEAARLTAEGARQAETLAELERRAEEGEARGAAAEKETAGLREMVATLRQRHAEEAEAATRAAETLRHEKAQIESALIQRQHETEDVGRQNAENAARVADLEVSLAALTAERDRLAAEVEQVARDARLDRARTEERMRRELAETLARTRVGMDARIAALEADVTRAGEATREVAKRETANKGRIAALEADLSAARQKAQADAAGRRELEDRLGRARAEHETRAEQLERDLATARQETLDNAAQRRRAARAEEDQRRRNAALHVRYRAILESRSWRVTAPLRRLATWFRSQPDRPK
ncbi:sulfotransferase family protein [Jannaschia rubra]|uniref:sulfotransferase family protein n=1 Tax=Jannaschia rubra TaxID=282197 RepID=UPI0024913813|nr:sulfotransferase family protein [Jannaschia rubra]